MNAETILEVILKLVGDYEVYGETNHDQKATENLKTLVKVTQELTSIIEDQYYETLGDVRYSYQDHQVVARGFLRAQESTTCDFFHRGFQDGDEDIPKRWEWFKEAVESAIPTGGEDGATN